MHLCILICLWIIIIWIYIFASLNLNMTKKSLYVRNLIISILTFNNFYFQDLRNTNYFVDFILHMKRNFEPCCIFISCTNTWRKHMGLSFLVVLMLKKPNCQFGIMQFFLIGWLFGKLSNLSYNVCMSVFVCVCLCIKLAVCRYRHICMCTMILLSIQIIKINK